jgi:hypothetical protein
MEIHPLRGVLRGVGSLEGWKPELVFGRENESDEKTAIRRFLILSFAAALRELGSVG